MLAVPALALTTLLVTAPATYAQSNASARDVYAFGRAKFLGSTGTAPLSHDTSSDGHVAVSLGDGAVISSAANHRIGVVPIGYFQNPLGWAASPW